MSGASAAGTSCPRGTTHDEHLHGGALARLAAGGIAAATAFAGLDRRAGRTGPRRRLGRHARRHRRGRQHVDGYVTAYALQADGTSTPTCSGRSCRRRLRASTSSRAPTSSSSSDDTDVRRVVLQRQGRPGDRRRGRRRGCATALRRPDRRAAGSSTGTVVTADGRPVDERHRLRATTPPTRHLEAYATPDANGTSASSASTPGQASGLQRPAAAPPSATTTSPPSRPPTP